ncbi:MAG: hypothetical protein ACOZE5_03770 [Verrucomicrobiota bacterium]
MLCRETAFPLRQLLASKHGRARRIEHGLVVLSILAIGWLYLWTAAPLGMRQLFSRDDAGYYNLLARGFLKGQLSMDVPPDPILATVDDPYDPAQRMGRGMHDATFYKGRFYIYFGVTPVLLVYLPFYAVTGWYITDACTVTMFAFAGFLLGLATLRSILRSWYSPLPAGLSLAAVWGLGLANLVPPLLRRPEMWEVPISCAYCLFMLTLFLLWQALIRKRTVGWLLAASVSMGLCIGARPTYLVSAAMLLVPLGSAAWKLGRGWWREGGWWKQAVAAILPILLIGIGLAIYNYQRFEDPFEFGQKYQLSGANENKVVHFSPRFFLFNLRLYLLTAPGFSPYFPFLTVVQPPPVPAGQLGIEDPYGVFPTMPWLFFALPAIGMAWWRRDAVGLWCAMSSGGVLLIMSTLFCFAGATGRYQVEFAPTLSLLAVMGVAGLIEVLPRWRRLIVGSALMLAGWSGGVNVLLSLQHNRLLEQNYPATYARLATAANHLPHWWSKLSGHQDGPVELRLRFPKDKRDKIEPLVVTGHQFLADYLFVHYLDQGLIRFGLEHTSRGTWTGPATRIDPDAEHTLVVQMGSLHPPAEHPAYGGMSLEEVDLRTRLIKVSLDGRTVLQLMADCYDASDWQPSIGTSGPHRPGFKEDFSGVLFSWRRLPLFAEGSAAPAVGKLHLLIRLPPFTSPKSEPLLSTGETGRGNLIYIRYLDATHYQIGHDRWGSGGSMSPVIGYDPAVPLDLDIACPPLLGEGAPERLVVSLNGSPLLDVEEGFYPSRPTQIAVGRNLIGASTAEAEFTGVIEIQERVAP